MTGSAWLETAKDDIAQWAIVMTKDADDNPIDWRWVRSLDLFDGLGHAAGDNPTPQAIHDALKADYAVRDRLEPIIAQCSTAFMTDFDRIIASYRLPRALAYVNRRLNDTINTLLDAGERRHLWKVSRERQGRGMAAVLKPYSSATADPNQGTLDAEAEGVDGFAGTVDIALDDIQDRSAAILNARAERRRAKREQSHAGRGDMARANLSGATAPGGSVTLFSNDSSSSGAAAHKPKSDWRDAYLPGRDVDMVMGIDIETTGTDPSVRAQPMPRTAMRMSRATTMPVTPMASLALTSVFPRPMRLSATNSFTNSQVSMCETAAARPVIGFSMNGRKPRPVCSRA